ncbi:MAG: lysylphosphatidylglycerol synthase transmembrane domain-containing protein [Candidatus Bilamarchaeaceae archaeon]
MKKQTFIIANIIISAVLVAALLYLVGVWKVLEQAARIDLFYLFLAILFLFLMDLVMAYRIEVLLKDMGENPSFVDILKCHFVGMLAADFTPARTGYFATAATMRLNYGIKSEKAMLSIFGPQIFDFATKLIGGTIAIFYIAFYVLRTENPWMLMLGAVVMVCFIAVMLLALFSKRFVSAFSFLEKVPFLSKLYGITTRMQQNSSTIVRKSGFIIFMIAFSWTFKALSWYAVAKAVGITLQIDFPELIFYFFLQPLVTMLEFVPSTTIAGLGLSEGANVFVLSIFGVEPATAMLFALVTRFKTTLLHLPAVPEALKIYSAKS